MATSFPFLAIARAFFVPYGVVIRLADSIDRHGYPLAEQYGDHKHMHGGLLQAIERASWYERRRRESVQSTEDGHR